MKLERHIGGLGRARAQRYLTARGWTAAVDGWSCVRHPGSVQLARALHLQLTEDLVGGLASTGWAVDGYSPRGYVRLRDPVKGDTCSLPAALRRQSRREGRPTRELAYSLFLASVS